MKENILKGKNIKGKNIMTNENWNLKVNIKMMRNGMEKNMIKKKI